MKIPCQPAAPGAGRTRLQRVSGPASRRHEQGMAVVIVITLLAILLIFVSGNIRTLHILNRELKLLEKRQIQRLQATSRQPNVLTGTNQPPALTNSPSK